MEGLRRGILAVVITAVLAFALGAGAVYGGFHYAVDVVFGAGVGGLAFIVSGLLRRAKA